MFEYRFGGKGAKPRKLDPTSEFVAIQVPQGKLESLEALEGALETLPDVKRVIRFESAGILVLRPSDKLSPKGLRASVLESLDDPTTALPDDRVLKDAAGDPVVYTDKIYIRFQATTSDEDIEALLAAHPIAKRQPAGVAKNAFVLTVAPDVGNKVFDIANDLLARPQVEAAHPELLRESRARDATKRQWHLRRIERGGVTIDQSCNALEAWTTTRGKGIVIAVIDDGVDTTHPEFQGDGKVVHPYDATKDQEDASPKRKAEKHGTACAGVACASGKHRASGVAPEATLLPIRLASGLGSLDELRAFQWAVDHGADVISCSWGPPDGEWWNPDDPRHEEEVPLPDFSRDAIEYALTTGRGGKGCVITWAAGNGGESADNDGYASHPDVIAVAACNDRGERSVYSDFGQAVWCTFPSNDFEDPNTGRPAPLTPGIWTTDRRGAQGYNPGHLDPGDDDRGDPDGDYAADFGGTSSACPGVAGMVALMLSANPDLRPGQVKELLRKACVKIDTAGGAYDAEGHSELYGYGRPDAAMAVHLAKSATPA